MESNKFADQRDWLKGNQKSFSGVHVPGIKDHPCSAPDKVASAKISAAGRKAFLIDHVKIHIYSFGFKNAVKLSGLDEEYFQALSIPHRLLYYTAVPLLRPPKPGGFLFN